jgi:hypothetical protein
VIKHWQAIGAGLAILVTVAGAGYVRSAAGNNGSSERKAPPSALSHIEPTLSEKALVPYIERKTSLLMFATSPDEARR